MLSAPIELRKRRDFSATLSTAFAFLRENWRPLLRAMLFICVPFYAVGTLLIGGLFVALTGAAANGGAGGFGAIGYSVAGAIIGYLLLGLGSIFSIALVLEYMANYSRTGGERATVGRIWRVLRPRLMGYIGMSFLIGLMFAVVYVVAAFLGALFARASLFLMFIILFSTIFYFLTVWSLSLPLRAFSGMDLGDCLFQPFSLVRGNWWKSFCIAFCTGFLVALMSYSVSTPFMVIGGFRAFSGFQTDHSPDAFSTARMLYLLFLITAMVVNLLLQPIVTVAVGCNACSLLEQRVGIGLMERIDQLTSQPLP